MKKTFIFGLIIFWIGATAILAYGFASYTENKKKNAAKEIQNTAASTEIDQTEIMPLGELDTAPAPENIPLEQIDNNDFGDYTGEDDYDDDEYEDDEDEYEEEDEWKEEYEEDDD